MAVVGLGYVGLPLAVEFGKKHTTIGLDLSVEKIEAYKRHVDPTGEVSTAELKAAVHLKPTTDASTLKEAEQFFAHGVTDIFYAVGIAPASTGGKGFTLPADRCMCRDRRAIQPARRSRTNRLPTRRRPTAPVAGG